MPRVSMAPMVALVLLVAGMFAVGAACDDDDDGNGGTTATPSNGESPTPGGGGEAGAISVTLQEWAVIPDPTEASAGSVEFTAENTGPDHEHELVIIRTDLEAGELPTDDNGAVDEEGEGIEVVDEIEEFAVGETQTITVDLEAGNYVLICNVVNEDEDLVHYALGMRTGFTVN